MPAAGPSRRRGRLLGLCLAAAAAAGFAGRAAAQSVPPEAVCNPAHDSRPVQVNRLPGKLIDIQYLGTRDERAVALVQDGALKARAGLHAYFKEGAGDGWTDLSPRLAAAEGAEGSLASLAVAEVALSPSDAGQVLFVGTEDHHWYSVDGLASFKTIRNPTAGPAYATSFKLHPTKPGWLLAMVTRDGCRAQGKVCERDVFFSDSFGEDWQDLAANSGGRVHSFADFDWAANLYVGIDGDKLRRYERSVVATIYEKHEDMQSTTKLHFVRTDDFFKSKHERIFSCGNNFMFVGGKIFMAVPEECALEGYRSDVEQGKDRAYSRLYMSPDVGEDMEQLCIPTKFSDMLYNVYATDGGGYLVSVLHDQADSDRYLPGARTLYTSAPEAPMLSLSLENLYVEYGIADIDRIRLIPGTFIANQIDAVGATGASGAPPSQRKIRQFVQSKISWDNGAHWSPLSPPATFADPSCNLCGEGGDCFLHLSGPSQWVQGIVSPRPTFYHHENAPGVIIANGNVGQYLDLDSPGCTFLSEDGGRSWAQIATGTSIFEFGDHGSLLIQAQHGSQGPTDKVFISTTAGACFNDNNPIMLSDKVYIDNIIVEPLASSKEFTIYGSSIDGGGRGRGVIASLDLTKILNAMPECDNADLRTVALPDCYLGARVSFERKTSDKYCFYNQTYARPGFAAEPCACTLEDVACEYGYEWVDEGTCVATPFETELKCYYQEGKHRRYTPSRTHFRALAGDPCTGLGRLIPDSDGYGHGPRSASRTALLVITIIMLLAGAGALGWACWKRRGTLSFSREGLREALEDLKVAARGAVQKLRGRSQYSAYRNSFQPLAGDATELGEPLGGL